VLSDVTVIVAPAVWHRLTGSGGADSLPGNGIGPLARHLRSERHRRDESNRQPHVAPSTRTTVLGGGAICPGHKTGADAWGSAEEPWFSYRVIRRGWTTSAR
jgi:hypothetical protein